MKQSERYISQCILAYRNVISQNINIVLNLQQSNSTEINMTYIKKFFSKTNLARSSVVSQNTHRHRHIHTHTQVKYNGRTLYALHHLKDFPNACRIDRNFHDDGFLAYAGDNISFDIEMFDQQPENFECSFISLELSDKRIGYLFPPFNMHKSKMKQHLFNNSQ